MNKNFHSNNQIVYTIFRKLLLALLFIAFGGVDMLFAQTSITNTGTNTYNIPAGVTRVRIECWGAGGGGGTTGTSRSNNNMQCGGGGGGAYSSDVVDVTGLTSISVFVGSGGNAGVNGENSYYGTTVVATGGKGATNYNTTAGAGGLASDCTGTTKNSGGNGAGGNTNNTKYSGGGGGGAGSTGTGANASTYTGGGATTLNGGAGGNGRYYSNGTGYPCNQYGGGGGGAYRSSNGPYSGGAGGDGLVVVTPLQVEVDASSGTLQSFYPNLKSAFDAINAGTHQGNLTIKIIGSTVETASAVLNASNSGSANYSSVLIYPTNPDISVSGSGIVGPLLKLNGADNVTINGSLLLTNAFPTLTFVNNNTSSSSSTILFTEDACNNKISYTKIQGVAASATTGIVVFSTASSLPTGTGNDKNTIEYCQISGTGNTSSTRPYNAIYSSGTNTKENSGNIIQNNEIYNFLNQANESCGIRFEAFTTNCTISGNSFYETSSFSSSTTYIHRAIYLNNTSGYFTVQGNYIGGSDAKAAGVWTKTGTDNAFCGIYLNVNKDSASNVQGNVIRNMNYTNSADTTWTGIYALAGKVRIGTIVGDTIGSGVGTGSVVLKNATATGALYGIYIASTDSVYVHNNVIGSITTANTSGTNSTGIFGIYKANVLGPVDIQNNKIGGSTTPNSIYASSAATGTVQHLMGIYSGSSTGTLIKNNEISNLANATTSTQYSYTRGIRTSNGSNTILNNSVHDLSSLSQNGINYLNTQLIGIDQISQATGSSQLIQGNTVYELTNTTTAKIEMYGIFSSGPSVGSTIIDRNFIHTYNIVSTDQAYLHGVSVLAGVCKVTNNVVYLGNNISTGCFIWGIWSGSASVMEIYHNTAYLSGQATTGSSNTYAFRDISVGSTNRTIKNNILWNARYNSNAVVSHYALYMANESGTVNINYNDYQYTQGFAQISGITYSAFSQSWRASYDANSIIKDPLLTNLGGTQASDYQPGTTLDCIKLAAVDTDFGFQTRPATATMGAWEFTANPVEIWKNGIKQSSYASLKAAFDAINAGTQTGSLLVKITANTQETAPAVLYNSRNIDAGRNSNYSNIVIYPTRTEIQVKGSYPGALVDLNGAAHVRFDGRVNLTGSTPDLHFINSSVDPNASTLHFLNSAESDTVQYCYLKGASPSATSGIVHFSTSSTGNGNDNNVISNCRLTNPGIGDAIRAYNAVYSVGTSGKENSGNVLSDNYFYDYMSLSTNSNGILIGAFSTDFTIAGNSFYQTSTINATSSNLTIRAISIDNPSGNNFLISGNYIGGQAVQCQGAMLGIGTLTDQVLVFQPIYLNVGSTTASSVQGNLITNFEYKSTNAAPFTGIYLQAGAVNVGTVSGNTIGSTTAAQAILLTANVAGLVASYGIYVNTTGDAQVNNNIIGGIKTTNTQSGRGYSFYGIYKPNVSGSLTINSNTIGSLSTLLSINASSVSGTDAQELSGIYTLGSGKVLIKANTIANLENGSTRNSASNSVYGIWIKNNGAVAVQDSIDRNFIYGLSSSSASSTNIAAGIYLNGGTVLLSNNIISLGFGESYSYYMLGIYDASLSGQTSYIYHNTSCIFGTYSGTTYSSSYFRASITGTTNLRNNIFYNQSTNGTPKKVYAMYFANSGSTGGTLISNYNDYYVATNAYTGYYLTGTKNTYIIVPGQDANSQETLPFPAITANANDPSTYKQNIDLFGVSGTGILTDFGLFTRNATSPNMGAWERINKWKGSLSTDFNTAGNWTAVNVPSDWDNVVFDDNPIRPCIMDQQRFVTDIVNAQSSYRFVLNGYKLNLKGQMVLSNGAQVDATASGSTLLYVGTSAQTLNASSLFNNAVDNLNINNASNVTLSGTLILQNTLTATTGKLNASNSGTALQFEGTSTQTLDGNALLNNNLYDLVVNNPYNVTLSGTLKLLNTLTATSGKLNASNSGTTLQYEGASTQTLDGNTLLNNGLYNLVVNNASNVTLSGTMKLLNTLTTTSGKLNATNSGTTLQFEGTSAQALDANTLLNNKLYNLVVNNAANVTLNGTLKLLNSLTATSGKLNATNSGTTLQFEGTAAQALDGNALLNNKLYNLVVNNAANVTLSNTLKLVNTLTTSSGKLNASNSGATLQYEGTSAQALDANTLLNNKLYNLVVNNASNVTLSGTLKLLNTLTTTSGKLNATNSGTTLQYEGATAQTLDASALLNNKLYNLVVNNASNVTLSGTLKLLNTLTATSGKLNASNSGTTLQFEGALAQTLNGSTLLNNKLYNLVVNNASNVTLSGTMALLNTLTATAGRLNASAGSTVVYSGTTQQAIVGNTYLNEKAYNLTASNPLGLILNTSFTVDNDLTISTGSSLTVSETKGLTVTGLVTNNVGAGGLLLKSSALGTASLIQSNSGVQATVERYFDGDTCAWHFMSAPVSDQAISGSWLPSGTYGDGTGYDMYVWNEATSCWIYKNNLSESATWTEVHPESNFVAGRGYIYAVKALHPTKQFVGSLNTGNVTRPVTSLATPNFIGFNLLGNPYPSSIDWTLTAGYDRSMLDASGGGYYMWTWSTTANNYGVYNSADGDGIGTNNVTRYIAPMQAFFVQATTAGTFAFHNAGRVHEGASVWLKSVQNNYSEQFVRLSVSSAAGRDEIKIGFGYAANESGAAKMFSPVLTAPSLYMNCGGVGYSIRRLTDTSKNKYIPVNFKAGETGTYTLNCNYDPSTLGTIYLEDRQNGTILDLSGGESYTFQATTTEAPERFVLHFGTVTPLDAEVHPNVWVSEGMLNVLLENMIGDFQVRVIDLQGRIIMNKKMSGSEQCSVSLFGRGLYVVSVVGAHNSQNIKVVY